MGAEWIEQRIQQAQAQHPEEHYPTWADSCGFCSSRENVWLVDMDEPWKYVDGARRQAPDLSSAFLDQLSYAEREDFLSQVGHVSSSVLCQACIERQLAQEPSTEDGIWSGKKTVRKYVRRMS